VLAEVLQNVVVENMPARQAAAAAPTASPRSCGGRARCPGYDVATARDESGGSLAIRPCRAAAQAYESSTREQLTGLALMATSVLLFVLPGSPIRWHRAWSLSLHSVTTLTSAQRWVGLGHYETLFADPQFWTTFANTVIWTVSALTLQLVLGIAIALMLHQSFFGRALARGFVLFPYLLRPRWRCWLLALAVQRSLASSTTC